MPEEQYTYLDKNRQVLTGPDFLDPHSHPMRFRPLSGRPSIGRLRRRVKFHRFEPLQHPDQEKRDLVVCKLNFNTLLSAS